MEEYIRQVIEEELDKSKLDMEKHSFAVVEEHLGQFTADDVGKPILAFDRPIGIITVVTENAVYGQIWLRNFKDWCRCGKIIKV